MYKKKKASLEISIQAIVIVVLAMTLLGLGLGFIKGLFGNITDISGATFDKISDQLQRDLVNSNERLVFSQTKVNVERGKSNLLGWGIRNDGNAQLEYWAEFRCIKDPTGSPCSVMSNSDLNSNWFTFKYDEGISLFYRVSAAEQAVERVDLTVPKDTNILTGLYLVELSIYDSLASPLDPPFATTDIFITVS